MLESTDEALVSEALRSIDQLSIVIVDREVRIRGLHGGAFGRHGHEAAQVVGERVQDVVPAAWERLGPLYARALEGETLTVDLHSVDGGTLYETTFQPVRRDGRVIGAMAISRDVTASRRAVRLFERSFHEAAVGALILRDGRIVRVNERFASMVGRPVDELIGTDPIALVHPDEQAEARAAIQQSGQGEHLAPRERRLVTADGETLTVRLRLSILEEEQGPPTVLVHAIDRTAEVRSVQERERALALFETSFAAAPIGMCLVGLDGRFLRVNAALCGLFGRSEPELLAIDFQEITHPQDLASDLALLQETLAGTRTGYTLEKRYLHADGSVIEAFLGVSLVRDEEGAPAHFISQIVDLTTLAQTRRDLAEAKGLLQSVLDHSPTSIYMRDLEHRWTFVNPEVCKVIGLSEQELIGRTMAETLPGALATLFAANDDDVLAAGEPQSFEEMGPDVQTNIVRHWLSLKFPVRDPEGTIVGVGGVSLDVTEREQVQRELSETRALFEAAFSGAHVGKLICRVQHDGATEIIECNPAFATMVGRDARDLLGRSDRVVVHPDDLPAREELIADVLAAGQAESRELRLLHGDGHEIWALMAPALVGTGDEPLLLLQALDISERKRFEGRLRYLADHDPLTGLLSRRRFEAELEREVARVARSGGHGCLLLIDLDGFKHVNDAFGHPAGDALLTRIGATLRERMRGVDLVARVGGDEFAIILPDTDLDGGRAAAGELVATVRRHGEVSGEGRRAEVTASIGIASIAGTPTAEQLLVEADIAMYEAKDAGKDRVAVYDRSLARREQLVRRADWLGRLRRGLAGEQFVLHAQPIVALAARDDAEHYELLLRLRDDDGELIPPATFLPHAERLGLIVDIDRWVLREAVGMLHRSERDLRLAVNFSPLTLQHTEIAAELEQLLREQPIPEHSLTIDVTETTAIANLTAVSELARALRRLGCLIALDDFGAGFASFAYLKQLSFDVLKIDGDFIDQLPASKTDQLVVRAITQLAHGLGITIIAERVADQASVELLTELGVHYGQGFFLAPPAPLTG